MVEGCFNKLSNLIVLAGMAFYIKNKLSIKGKYEKFNQAYSYMRMLCS